MTYQTSTSDENLSASVSAHPLPRGGTDLTGAATRVFREEAAGRIVLGTGNRQHAIANCHGHPLPRGLNRDRDQHWRSCGKTHCCTDLWAYFLLTNVLTFTSFPSVVTVIVPLSPVVKISAPAARQRSTTSA